MTSATDICPSPIRRFKCARARLIAFARSTDTRRFGTETIVAVSVVRVPPGPVSPVRPTGQQERKESARRQPEDLSAGSDVTGP